jgi:hypothetical protein
LFLDVPRVDRERCAALAAAYAAAKKKIDDVPTLLLQSGHVLYRYFDPNNVHSLLPKPRSGNHVSKFQANRLLFPADGIIDRNNRFSGPSYNPMIPASAGF